MISYSADSSTQYLYCQRGLLLRFVGYLFKKKTTVEAFLKEIQENFKDSIRHDIGNDTIIEHPKFVLTAIKDQSFIDVNGNAKDFETVKVISDLGKKYYETENADANIRSLDFYMTNRGLCYDDAYLVMDSLPSKLYVPYIDTDVLFEQFFRSSENILLLTGKSGIGKSKLGALAIDYLSKHTENVDAKIATASDVSVLSSDEFWSDLISEEVDLVILDDLDFLLTPRTEEQGVNDTVKNRFVSELLTFTDGFKKNKIKFIITTNQKVDTIDPSLLRKGRMFDIIELRELTNSEAKVIWENFSDKPFKLKGNILACDLSHEIELANSEFERKCYLRDPSVSRLDKTSKVIGF